MSSPTEKRTISFGVFELDCAAGQLFRNSRKVKLQEQPLRMLELLLDQPGNLVTRDEIRNALWPDDTFVEFDAAVANALRKVRVALGDDAANPRFVQTVPRQGYRFIAPVRVSPEELPEVRTPDPPRTIPELSMESRPWLKRALRWIIPALLFGLVAGVIEFRRSARPGGIGDGGIGTVLTSYPGNQSTPALSPDASQVAFAWREEEAGGAVDSPGAHQGLYIAMTNGGGTHRRITSAAANDYAPAWSPDGTRIAFVRDGVGLMLTAPLGGSERLIAASARPYFVSWSPDGAEIGYAAWDASGSRFAVFAINIETGSQRQITQPPAGTSDTQADFSPDGRRLAFIRCNLGNCDIYVMPSGGGTPQRLTDDHCSFRGLTWSPDGRAIVFSSRRRGLYRLWQVDDSAGASPRAVPSVGEDADYPRFAPGPQSKWRLVYEQHRRTSNIWLQRIAPADGSGRRILAQPSQRQIVSTRVDSSPQLSPDGRRMVFVSDRSGYEELWTADADGHGESELTFLRSQGAGSPRWSPDGTRIAFDMISAAGRAVFAIDAHGGLARQWTEWGDAARPTWSRDGRWIYFSNSDAAGVRQLWKVSAAPAAKRATPQQVTRDGGGLTALESADGKTIFYLVGGHLRSMPVEGGSWTPVMDRPVPAGWWDVAADGIWFADLYGGNERQRVVAGPKGIYFFDFKSRAVQRVAEIAGEVNSPTPDFCVSADGRTLLYSILEVSTSQVHMIEEAH